MLVVCVDGPLGDEAQVEGGRADPPDVAYPREKLAKYSRLLPAAVGEYANPVATRASAGSEAALVDNTEVPVESVRNAPPPAMAWYVTPRATSTTAPAIDRPSSCAAIETA